jgi:ABC-type branched-subunit amino acid transport system substrate-binding protein
MVNINILRGISRTTLLISLIIIIVVAAVGGYLLAINILYKPTYKVSEVKVGIIQPLSGSMSTIGRYNL